MILGGTILILLAFSVYLYYISMDSEEAPVSKQELGFVALTGTLTAAGAGIAVYALMYLRITALYPPLDGVDMGEPPF